MTRGTRADFGEGSRAAGNASRVAAVVFAAAATLVLIPGARACDDGGADDLLLNLTGSTGHSTNFTINATVSLVSADVSWIRYDPTGGNLYLHSTGMPSHDIGPWTGNPNVASAQNFT